MEYVYILKSKKDSRYQYTYKYLRSDSFDFDKFFDSDGMNDNDFTIYRYLRALDNNLPGIVDATKKLLENKADHYVVLGRGGDLIYWTMKFLLQAGNSAQCHLMDFSRYGIDCVQLARDNPDAFASLLERFGIDRAESVLIVDEFSTSGYFLPGVVDSFRLNSYNNTTGKDVAHQVVHNSRDLWGGNRREMDVMYDAMQWLGVGYNAGRTFKILIKNNSWKYVYNDTGSSNITNIRKNGQYLGWLNRAALYRYLINLYTKDQKVIADEERVMQQNSAGNSLNDIADETIIIERQHDELLSIINQAI